MRIPPLLTSVLVGGLLVAGGASGCGGDDETTSASTPAKATGQAVEIKAFQFTPQTLSVEAGTPITFTNADATTHTIVGGTRKQPDKAAIDGATAEDETYEVTLDEPGTYEYFCDIHSGPGMTAEIVVK